MNITVTWRCSIAAQELITHLCTVRVEENCSNYAENVLDATEQNIATRD